MVVYMNGILKSNSEFGVSYPKMLVIRERFQPTCTYRRKGLLPLGRKGLPQDSMTVQPGLVLIKYKPPY